MTDRNSVFSRRRLLQSIGAAAVSTGFVGSAGAIPSSQAATSDALENKKVFVGNGLKLDLPSQAKATDVMEDADVAILSSEIPEGRSQSRSALKSGTAQLFVGEQADNSLLSVLYDANRSEVASLATEGTNPEMDFSFGFEYQENLEITVAGAYPHGEKLSTHAFFKTDKNEEEDIIVNPGQNNGVSQQYTNENLKKFVGLNNNSETSKNTIRSLSNSQKKNQNYYGQYDGDDNISLLVDDSSEESSEGPENDTTSCADAGSGWDCLGRAHYSGDLGDVGDVDHYVWCAATDPSNADSDFNFFTLKSQMLLKPGIDQGISDYRNQFTRRNVQLANDSLTRGDHILKHGPNATTGTKSETFSADVSIGAKGELGASFGYSYTNTYSNVLIGESVGPDDQMVDHSFDLDKSSNPAENTFEAFPGCRINVVDDETNISYDYKNRYVFEEAWYDGGSNYSHREYGTGNWYL